MSEKAHLYLSLSFDQLLQVVKQLSAEKKKILMHFLAEGQEKGAEDITLTHFASENVLSKDWLKSEEDVVWKDL